MTPRQRLGRLSERVAAEGDLRGWILLGVIITAVALWFFSTLEVCAGSTCYGPGSGYFWSVVALKVAYFGGVHLISIAIGIGGGWLYYSFAVFWKTTFWISAFIFCIQMLSLFKVGALSGQ
jgi:hypothetical protein